MKTIIVLGILLFIGDTNAQIIYPNNEDGQYEDMLTPEYYLTEDDGSFRNEINQFVHFARLEPFQHPLEDSSGQMPSFTIVRNFGDGIGAGGTAQHHPAIDLHPDDGNTLVNLYAAHEGFVEIYRDAPKYRHYLSITKNIEDSTGNTIGKMVTLYAHIDLDLDSADNLLLDGQFVNKGELVSKHLYSGTLGGPHLHFEIRYYRPTDEGDEDYYGWSGGNPDFTEPSTGSWTYGYWNPNVGYGYANPDNHLNNSSTGIIKNDVWGGINIFPNPTKDFITIKLNEIYQNVSYSIFNLNGKLIERKDITSIALVDINLSNYKPGIYFIKLTEKSNGKSFKVKVIKE